MFALSRPVQMCVLDDGIIATENWQLSTQHTLNARRLIWCFTNENGDARPQRFAYFRRADANFARNAFQCARRAQHTAQHTVATSEDKFIESMAMATVIASHRGVRKCRITTPKNPQTALQLMQSKCSNILSQFFVRCATISHPLVPAPFHRAKSQRLQSKCTSNIPIERQWMSLNMCHPKHNRHTSPETEKPCATKKSRFFGECTPDLVVK